jgi:hypothetical protein
MRAHFPIGARAGRGARRSENVPPSLSEISTPAKNATGHSTGARAPVDARDDRRRARHRTTGARAGQNPTGHSSDERSESSNEPKCEWVLPRCGHILQSARAPDGVRADRKTCRRPYPKFQRRPKMRPVVRPARARPSMRATTDGRARRPRPPYGPGQNLTGHSWFWDEPCRSPLAGVLNTKDLGLYSPDDGVSIGMPRKSSGNPSGVRLHNQDLHSVQSSIQHEPINEAAQHFLIFFSTCRWVRTRAP